MFKVSLEPMTEVISDLQGISLQLGRCVEDIAQAKRGLNESSQMDQIIRQLSRETDRLEKNISQTIQMKQVLGDIQQHYQRCERSAADYCEESGRAWPRESTAYHQLDWVNKLVT